MINTESIDEVFQHKLIMASYPVDDYFIPDAIGYVDQLPFSNPNKKVKYPTWKMSTAIGGLYGETALRFKPPMKEISNFGILINSIAKVGQQNSLFCYSHPALLKQINGKLSLVRTETKDLFRFVAQHYKKVRLLILLYCFIRYKKKFPIWSFFTSVFKKSFFQFNIDLPELDDNVEELIGKESIEVIIPTLGRPQHLKNVLIDLKNQKLLPTKVIIVEQNPEVNSESELDYLKSYTWPFEIVHHFTRNIGVCSARNIALDQVQSNWVFFADDDIRFQPELLQNVVKEAARFQIEAINLNCRQPGEETAFYKTKQWGSFGAGTCVVKTMYAKKCQFSNIFEFGFGEDADFGMQLRNKGCDIIYHPRLQTLHLKASEGGFREMPILPWEKGNISPKPSPTIMAYAIKHFAPEQLRGYKVSLFLKYYNRQSIKNPVKYLRQLRKRWKLSEEWAACLLNENNPSRLSGN
ncbi:glycosyltransferase family 2 protein [Christiangramia aquimixticola]|uniref:glycosyltransferase family 2 protein n=1 Tax=Christiangramia aquimixticola TaxID=1697558 RepID=UPI003AA8B146